MAMRSFRILAATLIGAWTVTGTFKLFNAAI